MHVSDTLCVELRERRLNGESYESISTETNLSIKELLVIIKQPNEGCDATIPPVEEDQPWREKPVMESLFKEENMFFTEMSDLLGCHDETARNWVTEHGLSRKGTHHTSSKNVRHLQQVLDHIGEDVDPHDVSLKELQELSKQTE